MVPRPNRLKRGMRYRHIVVSRHGGPDGLTLVESELREPAPGEVRVAVSAAGVSGFDLMYRRWRWLPGSPKLPFTLGQDVVGVVDAIGEGVTDLTRGQRVAGGTWSRGLGGGYAESICLPAEELVPVPDGIDAAEAVCLVVNYLTAHQHLHEFGRPRHGERLLVHGAAGGVGTALLELGRLAGLEMYGTASRQHHKLLASLGATPIDYRSEDFLARIRTLTGDGVDVVVDTVGGAGHLWRSYRALRAGGRLVWLGAAATKGRGILTGLLSLPVVLGLDALPDGKRAPMVPDVGRFSSMHHSWYRATLTELLDLLAQGTISPVVAERLQLAEARRAHELLEGGGIGGKIVLVTDA
jgi:NADPH:quinone reductase-like Zn-dependent oxidoreductase